MATGTVLECSYCSRSHRSEDAVEKCKAKAERAAALFQKREAEAQRRLLNAEAEPWQRRVIVMRREAQRWDQISSFLKKNYPVGTPTDLWSLALAYAERLNWPVPDEVVAASLLEKFYVGEYITFHPMQLKEVHDAITKAGGSLPGKSNAELSTQIEDEEDELSPH